MCAGKLCCPYSDPRRKPRCVAAVDRHTRMQRVLYALPQFCPGARDPMLTRSLQSARNCVRCRPPARFDPRAPPPSPPAARVRERVRESACAGSASRSRRVRAALAPKLRAAAAVRALCAIASPVAVPSALRREPGRGAHLHLDACLPAQALLEHEVKKTRGSALPLTLRKYKNPTLNQTKHV